MGKSPQGWEQARRRAAAAPEAVGTPGKATLSGSLPVQRKASAGVSGVGGPLPHLERIQASFGPEHGVSGIRAHVGGDAATASDEIGASAYAMGTDVAFREQPDLHTAAHEAAHVMQQRRGVSLEGGVGEEGDPHERHADEVADRVVRGEPAGDLLAAYRGDGAASTSVQRQPAKPADKKGDKPTLRDWEVPEELEKLQRLRIDATSVRIVQEALNERATGNFTAADVMALSKLRVANGLSRYAEFTIKTLDLLVTQGIQFSMHDSLIYLVADFFELDTRKDALSIRFSPTLILKSTTNFDPAGMRMILIGSTAFTSALAIRAAIQSQLAAPVPAAIAGRATPGPVPSILTEDEAQAASELNSGKLADPRAIRAVQRMLRAPITGVIDATTSQFVARLQQARGLSPVDGSINAATFDELIISLVTDLAEESAVRVVIDYHKIPENGVTSVTVDPTKSTGDEYEISTTGNKTASSITFNAHAFFQPPARIVHTIARAFEDVRLRQGGVTGTPRKFLLEHFVTVSKGMAEETYVPFMADVVQALHQFKRLGPDDQAALWPQFEQVRDKVVARGKTADPNERAMFQSVEDELVAMPRPRP